MFCNDPKQFREEMLKGYTSAYSDYVVEVSGGVAKATELRDNKIAVINGGGSGHYPAFCGIIGEGFMDATVVGNVFTSPSTEDVYHVAKAVENGNGIFILGGNYAGDKMNFNMARDWLREEGIDARTLFVTDDVASAGKEEIEKRRGNVGTFSVFKIAGAASAEGISFDDLVRVTAKANDYTRTISVGLKGCMLPGQDEPLFHVPKGKMEVGQGIHGEPGVYETNCVSAAEIAKILVDRVLDEAPKDAGKRIAVILNGLGASKYEELFVIWGTAAERLAEKGYTLVEPQVGEFVTSLDMEGIALSVTFLDEELEKYWRAPADTPAFRKGKTQHDHRERRVARNLKQEEEVFEKGTDVSRKAAEYIVCALERMKEMVVREEIKLAKIDSVAGDGDHGRGMVKGTTYAYEAAKIAYEKGAAAGSVLKSAGRAWAAKAGGTSGILWGSALAEAGNVVGDHAEEYTVETVAKAVKAAYKKMMELGGADRGDKTMLDVLIPFGEVLFEAADKGCTLAEAWAEASEAAQKAAEDTAELIPKTGRARPLAERSLGTPDAGAVSMALCIKTVLL